MAQPTYDLLEFEFFNDNGTDETDSTVAGAGRNGTLDMGVGAANQKLIRIQLHNDNDKVGTETFNWEYNNTTQTTGWLPISTGSAHIRAVDSTKLTDGEDCTNRLTTRAGVFVANNNGVSEDGAGTSYSHTATYYSEQLLSFYLVAADVDDNDVIEIRVVEVSADTITYTNTPDLTVNEPSARRIFITHV